MGGAIPDGFVSILRLRNAALLRGEKSLLFASAQGSLDFPIAAKQMRRFLDPCGGPPRQEIVAATGTGAQSDEENLFY